MYSVGLDVDKFAFVSTELFCNFFFELEEREKILLCAGKSLISSPLVLITFGKIYLFPLKRQSAGNFSFSTKASAEVKNTYNNLFFSKLLKVTTYIIIVIIIYLKYILIF